MHAYSLGFSFSILPKQVVLTSPLTVNVGMGTFTLFMFAIDLVDNHLQDLIHIFYMPDSKCALPIIAILKF